ncbi:uncharacterized protein LOC129796589 isoform X4 [Lutzomyia longipalpis]|uniref:uncharacterized protein LOC129796589 isoform X4 n=1 Tax=Lutzomyia longipalpis TaxID=7200 RepID=UPI002483C3E4|nr:uncharacterized protein LOC129796589 isoform X4 [Lutzomyia longipalpis]
MRSELESFTLKQRVFLVKNYYQYTGDYLCVKTKYEDNYKDSNEYPPFSYDILIEIINLFERTGSVLKATEGAYGGTGQVIEQIYVRDFVKEEDPVVLPQEVPIPSTSTARVGEGDVTDDQEESMMWDQAEFPSGSSSDQDENIAEKHVCDQCNVSFKNLEDWNGHQMKKHNIIPDISKSSKTEHKKTCIWSLNKSDPLKYADPKNPLNTTGLHKMKMEDVKNISIAEQPSSITHDHMERVFSSTFKLDPTYDKVLKEITKKIDKLLRIQKNTLPKFSLLDEETEKLSVKFEQIFPIATKDDLNQFNCKLKDEEYRMNAKKELCKINGCNGTSDGTKCAYRLVDYIFTRDLLTLYSWTGASRTGTKEPFKNNTHFLDLFYTVIRMADNSYAKVDAYNFFKNKVLKYSIARLQMKNENSSQNNKDENS